MFLQQKTNHEMLEVLSLNELFDPFNKSLVGRYQHGEEVQDPEGVARESLYEALRFGRVHRAPLSLFGRGEVEAASARGVVGEELLLHGLREGDPEDRHGVADRRLTEAALLHRIDDRQN